MLYEKLVAIIKSQFCSPRRVVSFCSPFCNVYDMKQGQYSIDFGSIHWQVVREHHETGRDVEYIRKHLYDGRTGPTVRGTDGAALADGLLPHDGEHKIVKSRFSAFFATNLDLVLRRVGIDHIVVVGMCSSKTCIWNSTTCIAESPWLILSWWMWTLQVCGPIVGTSNSTDNFGVWIKLEISNLVRSCESSRSSIKIEEFNLRCKSYKRLKWRFSL